MVITAFGCGFSKKKFESIVDTRRDHCGQEGVREEDRRAILDEKLEVIASYFRRILKQTYGFERYSYVTPLKGNSVIRYKHINIGPMFQMDRSNLPIEILVACRYYNIELPHACAEKLNRFDEDIKSGRRMSP